MTFHTMRVPLTMALVFVTAVASPASAQLRRGQLKGAQPRREQLERTFGERLAVVVQRRLQLDDAGMRRLQQTNQKFERDRREMLVQERETRRALRAELSSGAQADQGRVSSLMDKALQLQRRRLDLLESEQRELSTFLSPVQRARYFAIQEELRRRVQEMRRARQAQTDSSSLLPR